MFDKRSAPALIVGAVSVAWMIFWNFVSFLSNVDFMRTVGGHPGIGTFFLPRGLADGLSLIGIGLIVYAYFRAERQHAERSPMPRSGAGVIIHSTCGAAKQMAIRTKGKKGEADYSIGGIPRKLFFEPGAIAVSDNDLPKNLFFVDGKCLTVKRYTETGFVVDDHGEAISFRVYVLECDR